MDKRFLDKVVDQIVYETRMDHDEGRMYTPFSSFIVPLSYFLSSSFFDKAFSKHCKNVYGLKGYKEVKYVWKKYKEIIKDKTNG